MVRTNRTSNSASANVDALDNIDLDDMFADDGDALFDGLDIDLGNIDEITGSGKADGSTAASVAVSHPQQKRDAPSVPASPSLTGDNLLSGRRQTKRKTKYSGYDDDDSIDVIPSSKRSKTAIDTSTALKGNSTSKGSKSKIKKGNNSKKNKKQQFEEEEDDDLSHLSMPPPLAREQTSSVNNHAKSSSAKSSNSYIRGATGTVTQPLPVSTRGTPSASAPSQNYGVAAAGQFGGRNKRTGGAISTSFGTLPKALKGNKLPLMSRSAGTTVEFLSKKSDSSNKMREQQQQRVEQQRQRADTQKKSDIIATGGSIASSSSTASVSSGGSAKRRLAPSRNEFCGLPPSNSIFYPFMPALPPEPMLKTRKAYGLVDQAHSTFLNHLTNAESKVDSSKEMLLNEPIFHLLEEAFREEVTISAGDARTKHATISNAISILRKSISQFDKQKLAEDLFSICSLLQKQHDFLKQNSGNMKRWCQENFPEAEYAAIYESTAASPDADDDDITATGKEVTVLESFGRRELKVKIVCDGFREPNNKSGSVSLIAMLPPSFEPPPPPPPQLEISQQSIESDVSSYATKLSKKRKLPISISTPMSPTPACVLGDPRTASVPYAALKPLKRRKCITELLSRTAHELEAQKSARSEDIRIQHDQQDSILRKFKDEDVINIMHTQGMWKYIDLSGYFDVMTQQEIFQRLDEIRSTVPDIYNQLTIKPHKTTPVSTDETLFLNSCITETTIVDRLQSLLVESDQSEGAEDSEADDFVWEFDIEICDETATIASETVDVSALSIDERAFLELRRLGLSDSLSLPHEPANGTASLKFASFAMLASSYSNSDTFNNKTAYKQAIGGAKTNGFGHNKIDQASCLGSTTECELDQITNAMMSDLKNTDELNGLRASFLESVAKSGSYLNEVEFRKRHDEEMALITKCRQQIVKSKTETRAKADWPMTWNSNNNSK